MVTVNHVIKSELEANPFIADLLNAGLLNVSALALKLQPKVERLLSRKVKSTAVSMAIRRHATNNAANPVNKWIFSKDMSISTKSNLYEISFKKNPRVSSHAFELEKQVSKQAGSFLSIIEGVNETAFLTNQFNREGVMRILGGIRIIHEKSGLGLVSIDFEPSAKEMPGIYYLITRALAFNNIPIHSMHTIGGEVILIFEGSDLLKAHRVITSAVLPKSAELQ